MDNFFSLNFNMLLKFIVTFNLDSCSEFPFLLRKIAVFKQNYKNPKHIC